MRTVSCTVSWAVFSAVLLIFLGCWGAEALVCPNGELPPASEDLAFCQVYGRGSCCSEAQSRAVLEAAAPFLLADPLPQRCRELSASFLCRPCFPPLAPGFRAGSVGPPVPVCERSCAAWFEACADAWFAQPAHQAALPLQPCDPAQHRLCFRLADRLADGAALCDLFGVPSEGSTQLQPEFLNPALAALFPYPDPEAPKALAVAGAEGCFSPEILSLPAASTLAAAGARQTKQAAPAKSSAKPRKGSRRETPEKPASVPAWASWLSSLSASLRKARRKVARLLGI